jgi:hypothetical protein
MAFAYGLSWLGGQEEAGEGQLPEAEIVLRESEKEMDFAL